MIRQNGANQTCKNQSTTDVPKFPLLRIVLQTIYAGVCIGIMTVLVTWQFSLASLLSVSITFSLLMFTWLSIRAIRVRSRYYYQHKSSSQTDKDSC